jgi:tetratricopeptide (TPR) repeat protein
MEFARRDEMNEQALKQLRQGAFSEAQLLFRENAKKNPSLLTWNNLGVFYMTEGMTLANGKVIQATRKATQCLQTAEICGPLTPTYMALGHLCFDAKEYDRAELYFERAVAYGDSYVAFNNYGVLLYTQYKYEKAALAFEKALELCTSEEKSILFSSYAFSVLPYDRQRCMEILHDICKRDISHILVDEFVLAYLCDDLEKTEGLCEQMLESWTINCDIVAMVFDYYFKSGNADQAKSYLQKKVSELQEYDYNTTREIRCVKDAFFDAECRMKLIKKYRYIPPILTGYYYYGCRQHGTITPNAKT